MRWPTAPDSKPSVQSPRWRESISGRFLGGCPAPHSVLYLARSGGAGPAGVREIVRQDASALTDFETSFPAVGVNSERRILRIDI